MQQPLHQQFQKQAIAVAITTLCVQYTILLMSQQQQEKAYWNEDEIRNLIDYLYQQRSAVGEGGNFRMATYNAAAEHISSYHSQGPRKTGKMCKTKWVSVCYHRGTDRSI